MSERKQQVAIAAVESLLRDHRIASWLVELRGRKLLLHCNCGSRETLGPPEGWCGLSLYQALWGLGSLPPSHVEHTCGQRLQQLRSALLVLDAQLAGPWGAFWDDLWEAL